MIPARIDHCPTLMMSSAGRPSRFAWRWPTQSPTTIEVAMRMPYQRTGNGPSPKRPGIWNAMAPGDANMPTYDTFPGAVRPRNADASETVEGGGGGRIRTRTSSRTEDFKSPAAAVTPRPPLDRIVSRANDGGGGPIEPDTLVLRASPTARAT